MKASVRCNALTLAALAAQEKHGKRLDRSSQARRIRESVPIVGGGLDLVSRLEAHTEGTKKNAKAGKAALHFIIRFPPEILTDEAPGPFAGKPKEERLRIMAKQAAKFVNDTHGGQAVFALRVDTDEQGETIVDVFACPKYEKTTKKGATLWTSLTKFGKALAEQHQDEICRRFKGYDGPTPITVPRAVGMALQSEFAAFFLRVNGSALSPKVEKTSPTPDRLETEAYKLKRLEEDAAAAAVEAERISAKSGAVLSATAALMEEIAAGTLRREAGRIVAANSSALTPGLPDLKPAIIAGATIGDTRRKVEEDAAAAREARTRAEADAKEARRVLDGLKEAYRAVRMMLPNIRRVLTWDLATEDERRRARLDRKQAVQTSPFLRRLIGQAEQSTALEEAREESGAMDGPGF